MHYDFVILGGGSAGFAAAHTAVRLGLKTAVVEGGQDVGGLCILRGCMPSKALIESSERYRTLLRAPEFGLHAEAIQYAGSEIIARKRRLIEGFASYRCSQLEKGDFDFLRGEAHFLDPHTIRVLSACGVEETLSAATFLIATGSVVSQATLPGLLETGFLTSDDILNLEELPRSIIVLGAGPVALELAHYLEAFGVQVTLLQRSSQLLSSIDEDIAEVVRIAGEKRGIRTYTQTQMREALRSGSHKKTVRFEHDGKEKEVHAEEIFYALGRTPATRLLALDVAGVRTTRRGNIETLPTQQTSAAHIFAAGDVCGPHEIVHVAIQQGEIAARNAKKLLSQNISLEEIDTRLLLFAVFTHPEVACVGLSEREAGQKGIPFLSAKYPFSDHGKSMVMGETEGFVKLLAATDSREILGGAVVGPRASELIHEVTVAMHFHATAFQFAAIPHYHPTLSEIWTYPAEELIS